LHIYRSRLAPKTVRPMSEDLRRGTPSDVNVASISAPKEDDCASALTSFLGGCE
jgi:soluble lytic murein transglycosylase